MSINRNKKSEKAFHAKARNTWERNPLTQVVSNAKAYNRKNIKEDSIKPTNKVMMGLLLFLAVYSNLLILLVIYHD